MEKMKFETPDLAADNVAKIGALFPNCITETVDANGKPKRAVNFDLLRQMLSGEVVDGREAYEFSWVGKRAAIAEANQPIHKTLRPCKAESKNWDTTENLYIEGDNLQVLKLLQESYLGKVKMIYIDPPYNTGNDFIYADNFARTKEEENTHLGMYDDDGNHLVVNSVSNGRFHSDWCSMIYSRLMLARNLMADDGVIFISIDDNEIDNLKKICAEVFGEFNEVALLVIASNSAKNNSKYISVTHEYLLCVSKNKISLPVNWAVLKSNYESFNQIASQLIKSGLSAEEIHSELLALVKYPKYYEFDHFTYADKHVNVRGPFQTSDLTAPGSKAYYDIIHPVTGKPCKLGTRGWAYSKEEIDRLTKEDYILFGEDETVIPRLKNYLVDNKKSLPKSVLFFDSQASTKWMKSQKFGFDYPKAVDLMKYIVSMYPEKDLTTLDFFSGSATTAHAVMQLNAEDGGHRKFIMVQLPEPCDEKSEAYKAGYKNICEIGKERIRRAGEKIKAESPLTTQQLDVGFRVLKLADSNMEDVYYAADEYSQQSLLDMVSNIKPDRTDLDLLFGCLLDWGIELSMPYYSETIQGCTVHTYNDGDLIACFDANIPESVIRTIAQREDVVRVVFRDSCFANSPDKINVFEIFKLYKPEWAGEINNHVRVI